MSLELPNPSENFRYLSIGDAAAKLKVSVDTLRRWDKAGKLTAVRLDGKNRFYRVSELESLLLSKPLTISEAADKLGVSASTLRRREREGVIKPLRNEKGERRYTLEMLSVTKESKPSPVATPVVPPAVPVPTVAPQGWVPADYQPRTGVVSVKIEVDLLGIWNGICGFFARRVNEIRLGVVYLVKKVRLVGGTLVEIVVEVWNLRPRQRWAYAAAMAVVLVVLGGVMVGYSGVGKNQAENRVLGARSPPRNIFEAVGGWFSGLLGEEELAEGHQKVEDVSELFELDDQGRIIPKKVILIPEGILQIITKTETIEKVTEVTETVGLPKDLVYWASEGRIDGLVIPEELVASAVSGGTGGVIKDDSITAADLAAAIITVSELADSAVTGAKIKDGEVGSSDITDGTISSSDIADGTVSSSDIADNTITTSDLAGTLTFGDGEFLDLASIIHDDSTPQGLRLPNTGASPTSPSAGEGYLIYDATNNAVKVYNGSSWTEIGGTVAVKTGGGLQLVSEELTLLTSCDSGQLLKWNGSSWACGDDSGAGGAGISTVQEGDVTAVSSATTIDFLAADFTVGGGAGEADISIDYTNSKIVRSDQAETITGGWTFNTAATVFTTSITANGGITAAGNINANAGIDVDDVFVVADGGVVTANTDVTLTLAETEDLAVNISISGTNSGQGQVITLTNSSSSGNQYGLYVDNAASTGTTEALVVLDNSDADTVVTSAIKFVIAGGTGFTNLFDINGTLLTSSEVTILDSGVALSELTDSGTLTATTVDINGGNIDGTTIGGTSAGAGTFTTLTANTDAVLGTGTIETGEIEDSTIAEADLKVVDAANDEECLTYETTTGDFEWQSCGSGGSLTVRETDAAPAVTSVTVIEFGPTGDSTADFVVSDQTGGVARVVLGSNVGHINTTESVSGAWTFSDLTVSDTTVSLSGGSTALDMSSASTTTLSITNAGAGVAALKIDGLTNCNTIDTDGFGNLSCGTDEGGAGGGIATIKENDVNVVTSATIIDFLGADFIVGAVGTEGNVSIDYTNSKITRNDQSETINNDWTFSLAETEDLAVNISISGTNAGQGEVITLTNSSSSGNQYGLYVDNAASTGTTEALLVIDNSDTDTVVTSAIQFVIAGGTGFTNLFDVNGTLLTAAEVTLLDSGVALSELTDSGTLTATTVDINGGNIDGTTIGGTAAGAATVTNLTAGGTINFADAGADTITLGDANDTLSIGSTAFNVTTTGAVSGVTSLAMASDLSLTLAGTENIEITHDLAGTINVLSLIGTPNASANTAYGIYIAQNNSANANGLDAGIVIENLDVSGAPIVAAIKTVDAGSGFTSLFDINGTLLSSTEVTLLDSGVALSELSDSGTLTVTTVDINGGNIDGTTIGGTSAGAGTFTTLTGGGTINFADAGADTITIGDANDTFSIGSTAFTVSNTGAVSGVTTLASSGDWTWSATTPSITINDNETLTFADAATADTFTINTSGSLFSFSDGTNSYTFDVDSGPVYAGGARPARKIVLAAEYPGASLTGDGTSNTGTMTSDFCENGASADIPQTNTGVCNTSGDIHSYYSWTTGQGTAQDYDIWVRYRIPDNFAAWDTNPVQVYGKRTDTTNNAVTVYVYDTAGALNNAGGTQVAGTTWTQTAIALSGGTWTAGNYMTLRVVLNADTGGDSVQVGEINLNYLSTN